MLGLGQDQDWVQTEIGSDVLHVECKHFARECPTRQENRETEQIQQMFSLDNDQTILQTPLIDTEDDIMMVTPMETRDSLNL